MSIIFKCKHSLQHLNSLEVSAGVNWGIGIADVSASITAGFETTWSTSETWSRSNREEILDVSIIYILISGL